MAKVTDRPPKYVRQDLQRLRSKLDHTVPSKRLDDNLIIGTWNIRAFGGLTDKWRAGDDDSPKRDLAALRCIASIVSRFDVVAIQEIRGELRALRHMMDVLGPHWGMILTDVTEGKSGNNERLGFVFDTRRVKPSGLACELVVPPEWLERDAADTLREQFARTPYAVSFLASGQTFILVTLHVKWGKSPKDRLGELKGIAEYMAKWARDVHSWHHNLIALGDFNIDRRDDPAYQAFTSTGLQTPPALNEAPRTIFAGDKGHFYDQIAWFGAGGKNPALTLGFDGNAGYFDFVDIVLGHLDKTELSWRMSDHYPLWAEFSTRTE
ncbi:MAG: endonuclease/exonuclease/phosphatase family protein [Actinomycetota bacterium]